jgi:hypothetical protein
LTEQDFARLILGVEQTKKQLKLHVVPLELKEANTLVEKLHRHHKPLKFHRFSIGCVAEDGTLVGGAIIGPPVATAISRKDVLEVSRLVTDGTPNACSILYAAAARAGKALGYKKIQTYILDTEPGTSLLAAGWEFEVKTQAKSWVTAKRPNRRTDQPICPKQRWAKILNIRREDNACIP